MSRIDSEEQYQLTKTEEPKTRIWQKVNGFVVVLLIVGLIAGLALLQKNNFFGLLAVITSGSQEAESGNLSQGATVGNDSGASGGQYVQLVPNATPTTPPASTSGPTTTPPGPTNTPQPTATPGPTLPPGSAQEVLFSQSNTDFMNPERGGFKVSGDSLGDSSYSFVRQAGLTLARSYIRLDPYVNSATIPTSFIANLDAGFARIRAAKIKIIPRLSYNYGASIDANPTILVRHLEQLKDVFARNSDVIYAIPAGLVGQWGEWHGSPNYQTGNNGVGGNYSGGSNSLDTIYKAILQNMPSNRMVLLRYPASRLGIFPGQTLTSTTAFGGSPLARAGFHNDCFLATNSWEGNYVANATYVHNETRYVPLLGAVCQNADRLNCDNARRELSSMHWSGLNFDTPNMSYLSQCRNEIKMNLGYRFWLKKVTLPTHIPHGSSFTMNLDVANVGYAPLYNPRPVYAVLENTSTGVKTTINLGIDPRKWQSQSDLDVNQVTTSVSTAGLSAGTYKLYLWLPDDSASLKNIPEYAIRLASLQSNNTDVWDSSTGYNFLTTINLE